MSIAAICDCGKSLTYCVGGENCKQADFVNYLKQHSTMNQQTTDVAKLAEERKAESEFMQVLLENYQANKSKHAKGVWKGYTAQQAVNETYEDLIAILKNLPLKRGDQKPIIDFLDSIGALSVTGMAEKLYPIDITDTTEFKVRMLEARLGFEKGYTLAQQSGLRWIRASERLPVKPKDYPYEYTDDNEPPIVFINRKHDGCFLWYLSMGYDVSETFEKYKDLKLYDEGWTIENWEWLDETPNLSNKKEIIDFAEWLLKSLGAGEMADKYIKDLFNKYKNSSPSPISLQQSGLHWRKVESGLPDYGKPVFCRLQWVNSGKIIGASLIRVKEDDCEWRTEDDRSEISYSLNVIEWLDESTPAESVSAETSDEPISNGDYLRITNGKPYFKKAGTSEWVELIPKYNNTLTSALEKIINDLSLSYPEIIALAREAVNKNK